MIGVNPLKVAVPCAPSVSFFARALGSFASDALRAALSLQMSLMVASCSSTLLAIMTASKVVCSGSSERVLNRATFPRKCSSSSDKVTTFRVMRFGVVAVVVAVVVCTVVSAFSSVWCRWGETGDGERETGSWRCSFLQSSRSFSVAMIAVQHSETVRWMFFRYLSAVWRWLQMTQTFGMSACVQMWLSGYACYSLGFFLVGECSVLLAVLISAWTSVGSAVSSTFFAK